MQGTAAIVTDCEGAATVANRLRAGVRKLRGRNTRLLTVRVASSPLEPPVKQYSLSQHPLTQQV
eukprot:5998698-Amphidinium_carterae.1